MTTHLLGPAFTTLSTKKKKTRGVTITAKFAQEFREHNDLMKRVGSKQKTVDEYITYRKGNFKPKLRGVKLTKLQVSDHREKYPSGQGVGISFAKEPNQYTGTLIKGISTMHKSNAVPVISEEEMLEHSQMRRG
jgi:hypothetical protein